jgi:cbb3-type cytochrome oxidase maturation protein
MHVMFVLIGASLFVAIGFVIAFIWSARRGQYDDMHTPAVRVLFDDTVSNEQLTPTDMKES